MPNNFILFDKIKAHGNTIGQITLNRPEALNALNHDMIRALRQQLELWAEDSEIQSVQIQSGNNRAFCAGGDLREIYTRGRDAWEFFWDEYRLAYFIYNYPKPYTAFLDGLTMGGGAGISIHGSRRIVTDNVIFAMPETGIGLFPDIGASYFLSRCPGETGIYLGLTGARITAGDMLALGLADEYASGKPPQSPLAPYRTEIDRCFSANTVEEIISRLSEQESEWHQATLLALREKSPTSLKVTLRQLRQGRELNLHDCLQMEYNLALHFLDQHDFFEGIRAAVIDKDRAPQWEPNALELVTDNQINEYFQNNSPLIL